MKCYKLYFIFFINENVKFSLIKKDLIVWRVFLKIVGKKIFQNQAIDDSYLFSLPKI